jgi:hypothetical protein
LLREGDFAALSQQKCSSYFCKTPKPLNGNKELRLSSRDRPP